MRYGPTQALAVAGVNLGEVFILSYRKLLILLLIIMT